MASNVVLAAAHSVPPVYKVPLGPRVRPPRLLPGTKAANTNPQPEGDVPQTFYGSGEKHDNVWVQGKWRHPNSRASRAVQGVQSRQVEKALSHASLGINIYAYRQIRTNQVVYSLTRNMQNSKILKQLIFHGKQTVPAALRRDVWRPYFSVHFEQTPAGARAGLEAFRLLRELSTRRQLSPPEGFLIATQEDVDNARARYDPANLAYLEENERKEIRMLPRLGQLLPPKYRARKLMDQQRSSVADLSFVLGLINDAKLSPAQLKDQCEKRLVQAHKERSQRNRRRINAIRREHEAKDLQIEVRQKMVDPKPGQLNLDRNAAARIAMEHGGAVASGNHVVQMQDLSALAQTGAGATTGQTADTEISAPPKFNRAEAAKAWEAKWAAENQDPNAEMPVNERDSHLKDAETAHNNKVGMSDYLARKAELRNEHEEKRRERDSSSRAVQVLWADQRDALYVQSWPLNVDHDWLEGKAAVKRQLSVVRQEAMTDDEGYDIAEQRQTKLVQSTASPHIMGRSQLEGWYLNPEQLHEQVQAQKEDKIKEWERNWRENTVREMIYLGRQARELSLQPHDQRTAKQHQHLGELNSALKVIQDQYPSYAKTLQDLDRCARLVERSVNLRRSINANLSAVDGAGETGAQVAHERRKLVSDEEAVVREIRDIYDSEYPGFSRLERERQELLAQKKTSEPTKETKDRLLKKEVEIEIQTVNFVLTSHEQVLKDNNDPNYDSSGIYPSKNISNISESTTSNRGGRTINHEALRADGVEVADSGRGIWGRIKGIFGR